MKWSCGVPAFPQVSQIRCLQLGISTSGNAQLAATCGKLILSDMHSSRPEPAQQCSTVWKKTGCIPPKPTPSQSSVLLPSRAACFPQLLPCSWTPSSDHLSVTDVSLRATYPRLRCCPVLLAGLLRSCALSHFVTCLQCISEELRAPGRSSPGHWGRAKHSWSLCPRRESPKTYGKQHIFPCIPSQKLLRDLFFFFFSWKFLLKIKREAETLRGNFNLLD